MANLRSAEKRNRQNDKLRLQNKSVKSTIRSAARKLETAIIEKKGEEASTHYKQFVKLIDTAAGKNIYHKNTAARKKSRLCKKLATLSN